MSKISRKQFLQNLSLAGMGAVAAGSGISNSKFFDTLQGYKKIEKIGLQLYTIIPLLKKDFEGTLKELSEIGYEEVEFAGPYFFSDEQLLGENKAEKSGYYGNNAQQTKSLLQQYGLEAPSAHVNLITLKNKLPQAIEAAHTIGHKFLVCPFLDADQRTSLDDYKQLAEDFNKIGEECQKADIQFAYHNHCFEFGEMDGQIPYNILLENTDNEQVKMELDIYWIKIAGYDPLDYFKSYPGRFPMVHVKDMKKKMVLKDPTHVFEHPAEAKEAMANLADVGKGVIDFKAILSKHDEAGIQHYFVERDWPPHPLQTIKNSYANLSTLTI